MNATTLALFLLIRVIVPFSILISLGEWMRRREVRHRLHS